MPMPTPKPTTTLMFFFLILLLNSRAINSTTLLQETCKTCALNDPNVDYAFCLTSLQAAPHSRCSSLRQLGYISINLIRHNATSTRSFIYGLLKTKKKMDPFLRACLRDCFQLYSDSILTLNQTILAYNSKHYDDASVDVSSVLDASTTCEDGFKEKKGLISPLTDRNNNTFMLSALSLSIITMLRPSTSS